MLYLDNKVLEGAFNLSCCWYTKGIEQAFAVPPHTHDCDEVLAFIGNDPTNPLDLGGEIEMWIDNEKHLINKSCLVFIPKGMPHCPMRATRVDRQTSISRRVLQGLLSNFLFKHEGKSIYFDFLDIGYIKKILTILKLNFIIWSDQQWYDQRCLYKGLIIMAILQLSIY